MRNNDIPNHIIRRALVSEKTILDNSSQPGNLPRSRRLREVGSIRHEGIGYVCFQAIQWTYGVDGGINEDEWPDICSLRLYCLPIVYQ
jgi:hypothetical protein